MLVDVAKCELALDGPIGLRNKWWKTEIESGQVDARLLIIGQVLSREVEEYEVETHASLAARELIDDGVNVPPAKRFGYVITNEKVKTKAERVNTSNRNGSVHYDRQEYAARLKVAAKEVGVLDDDDPPKSQWCDGATGGLLFPD
jgi:DNA polymerase elongation subunit (family B)